MTSQYTATLPSSDALIPITKEPNPSPTKIRANENFTAVFGLYFPNFTQSHAKTGANKIINKAFSL